MPDYQTPALQPPTYIVPVEMDVTAVLPNELECANDMLSDARLQLEILREALGVSYEPHQSLFERMVEASQAKGATTMEPADYQYKYESPTGRYIWHSSPHWNNQKPIESRALYTAPRPDRVAELEAELVSARELASKWQALWEGNQVSAESALRLVGRFKAEVERLRKDFREAREALQLANDSPDGGINDTIWMPHRPETLFDFIDDALAAKGGE